MENKQLKSFKDLKVWQKAIDLASLIYKATDKFPRSELYGITNQMRRSVISISSNIAEGFKRSHQKEKIQFYNIAYGSAAELESQIEVALKLNFLSQEDYQKLNALTVEAGKMLDGLIKSVNKSSKSYILNSIFFFTSLYSIFYILNPVPAFAAELKLSSSQTQEIALGQQFQVDLLLDAEGESLNAIEGKIVFPDILELKNIYDGDSIISLWVEKPSLNSKFYPLNSVFFSGIIPGGFRGVLSPYWQGLKPGKVFSLIFEAKNPGAGTIEAKDVRTLLNDGKGTETGVKTSNYPSDSAGGQFLISKQIPIRRFGGQTPTLETKDGEPPESFRPEIIRDPNVSDNKWFLVFAAQDKGTGIERYEILEKKEYRIRNLGPSPESYILHSKSWIKAESPYILNDQKLRSYIYVKAVDGAGNERTVIIEPRYPLKWYENYWIWVIIILIIMVAVLLFLRQKKNKKLKLKIRN